MELVPTRSMGTWRLGVGIDRQQAGFYVGERLA